MAFGGFCLLFFPQVHGDLCTFYVTNFFLFKATVAFGLVKLPVAQLIVNLPAWLSSRLQDTQKYQLNNFMDHSFTT